MTKLLSKRLRNIHRWVAVPTAPAIPIAAVLAFVIGAMAVFAGGKVLLGVPPDYYVIVMLILLTAYRPVVAPDSLVAMAIRLAVWSVILILLVIQRKRELSWHPVVGLSP